MPPNNLTMPDGTVLDPRVLKVMGAIRNVESGGNYNAVGDNGNSHGAYQFNKDNYKNWAKEYGLDPNDFSPAAQNKVAYMRIKGMKDEGNGPEDIAARWNGATFDSSTNRYNYNNPDYGVKFRDALMGKNVIPQTTDNPDLNKDNITTDPTQTPEVKQHINEMFDQGKTAQDVQDYIHSIKTGDPAPTNSETTPTDPGYLSKVGDEFKAGGEHIVSSLIKGGDNISTGAEQAISTPGILNKLKGLGKLAFGVTQSGLGTFAGGVQTAFSPITPIVTDAVKNFVAKNDAILAKSQNNPAKTVVDSINKQVAPALDKVAQSHPEEAGLIGDAITTLLTVAAGSKASDIQSPEIKNPLSGITGKLGSKTAEDILATPESEVAKLKPDEQKLWYKNQARTATETANNATIAAKKAGEDALTQTKTEIQNLNQTIGSKSRDTTIDLKPKVQKVMRDASDTYVELSGEAADGSPALTKTISHEDLTNKIDSKFEYDTQTADSLKQDLGIKSQLDTAEGAPQKLTNQEILDKAREIMQTVSKGARTGSKVYSSTEYEAMKKYSFLMETLGDNGVDMSAANKFWKEYAPVRDRMVREIKPFDDTNTGKMPFTSTVQNAEAVAKTAKQAATKIDAQHFIGELEKRMNLPEGTIGSDIRDSVTGLEKAKLTKENISTITKDTLAKIKADKVEALKTMSLKEYDTVKSARNKSLIKKAILVTLGLGAVSKTSIGKTVLHTVAGAAGL